MIILFCVFSSQVIATESKITVEDMLKIANEKSELFAKNKLQASIAKDELYAVYTDALPHINITQKREKIDMEYTNNASLDRNFTSSSQSVSIDQNLSIHKLTPKLMQSYHQYSQQKANLDEEFKELKLKTVGAFLSFYKNHAILPLVVKIETNFARKFEYAKAKFESGGISKAELLEINARFLEAKTTKMKVENELKVSASQYEMLVGELHDPSSFNVDSKKYTITYKSFDELIARVMHGNSKITASKHGLSKSRYSLAKSSADLLPDVNFGVSRNRYKNLWYMPGYPDLNQNVAKLELAIPIFDGGKKFVNVHKDVQGMRIASMEANIAQDEVYQRVLSNWNEYSMSSVAEKQYKMILDSMTSQSARASARYQGEVGSISEYTEFDVSMLRAKMNYIEAKCKTIELYYKLLYSIE